VPSSAQEVHTYFGIALEREFYFGKGYLFYFLIEYGTSSTSGSVSYGLQYGISEPYLFTMSGIFLYYILIR
jgi:hypothetical protein